MSEYDDPEASFRRGYELGARDTLKALEAIKSRPMALLPLSEWVEIILHEWRHHDRLPDRSVPPPKPPVE